jgi:uncharacterized protein YdcH (DUF465 family)
MTLENSIAESTIQRAVERYKTQRLNISDDLLSILKDIDENKEQSVRD